MRGKRRRGKGGRGIPRITPAGAGKTRRSAAFFRSVRDHPRRCGENAAGCPWRVSRAGITPAGAGKTDLLRQDDELREDHPRRCGENSDITSQRSYKSGSPPQVRGKQKMSRTRNYATRITPAGAGKTKHSHNTWSGNRDHPRRCGENS